MAEQPDHIPQGIEGDFHAAGHGGEEGAKKPSPFHFLPASYPVPENQVTATLLVPFMSDGRILVVEHAKRGIDIPGGHKDISDRTNFETARRELLEESGALIGHITPCLIMKTDQYKRGAAHADEPTYMIVMTGVVQELGRFNPSQEVVARHLLSPEVFLESYGGEYAADMSFIIKSARQTIDHERGAAPDFSSAG